MTDLLRDIRYGLRLLWKLALLAQMLRGMAAAGSWCHAPCYVVVHHLQVPATGEGAVEVGVTEEGMNRWDGNS